MSRCALQLLWGCALAALAQVAAADGGVSLANVTLIQDPCGFYDGAELVRLLQLELSARGVGLLAIRERLDSVHADEAGLAVVHLRCDAERSSVWAEVADLASGNQIQRALPLADVEPAARARALSLAVAALVEASWLELTLAKSSPTEPDRLPIEVASSLRERARERLATTAPPPSAAQEPAAELALLASARAHPTRTTGLLGVELLYTPSLARLRFSGGVEALLGGHQVSDAVGSIAFMHTYALGASLALAWASATQPELAFGPCVRLGYAAASASDVRAGAAARGGGGFFATAGARVLMRAQLTARWDLWLGFDLGYTVSGVVFEAGTNQGTGMTDLTLGLQAGLGVRP